MNEEIEFILDSTKEAMVNALKHLEKQFINIRAGKANPSMLGSVMVDYYGTQTPLTQVANVNTPDGRTITVQPWEKAMLQEIERAIMIANLGFNPMNNGETIIINVPPLTEERRRELAKQAKSEVEDAKISIRCCTKRRQFRNQICRRCYLKIFRKNAEVDVQQLTDTHVKKADDLYAVQRARNSQNLILQNFTFSYRKLNFPIPCLLIPFIYLCRHQKRLCLNSFQPGFGKPLHDSFLRNRIFILVSGCTYYWVFFHAME